MAGLTRERTNDVEIWTFDRPAARNAIDPELAGELATAVAQAERDGDLRALVLTGAGDQAFIAGADLKFLRAAEPEVRAELDQTMVELLARLEALPVPVIAALNGVAVGGGTEVALACDMRIAEPHASFTFKHARMGVTPGWGGLGRLVSLVGRGTASKLLFTAQPMDAEEALRAGLVDEVVGPKKARTRALELAEQIAENSPSAVADLKRLLSLAYRQGPALTSAEERRTFLERAHASDHTEALSAFFERRTPRFQPR